MKVIVTGGIGFVGRRLIPMLIKSGMNVLAIDKRNNSKKEITYDFKCVDLCDRSSLTEVCVGYDAIIHLAAEHKDNIRPISLYDEVNVEGTRNVTLAAEANGIERIVFTSSVSVYPLSKDVDENTDPQPYNDYGRTKLEAEEILRGWQSKMATRSLVIVRPTVIFGEGNRGNVYNLMKQVIEGPFLMVGRGSNIKSMSYVENVASFLLKSLERRAGVHLYNYVDKPDMSVKDLVLKICQHSESKLSMYYLPYPVAYVVATFFDFAALFFRREMPLSRIRLKKFVSNTVVSARHHSVDMCVNDLDTALKKTIDHDFLSRDLP